MIRSPLLAIAFLAVFSLAPCLADDPATSPAIPPANPTVARLAEEYRRVVSDLRRQVAELKNENEKLRKENADLKAAAKPNPPPVAGNRIAVGMTMADVQAVMARTKAKLTGSTQSQEKVGNEVHQYETWQTSSFHDSRIHFTDGIVDRVSDD